MVSNIIHGKKCAHGGNMRVDLKRFYQLRPPQYYLTSIHTHAFSPIPTISSLRMEPFAEFIHLHTLSMWYGCIAT